MHHPKSFRQKCLGQEPLEVAACGLLYSWCYYYIDYSGESSAQISPTSSSCLVQLMPFIIIIRADWALKPKNKNEHSIKLSSSTTTTLGAKRNAGF